MFSLYALKKKLFSFEDVVRFHFTLMNVVILIREKYEEVGYDCYCNIYRGCCFYYPCLRLLFKKRRSRFCTMCKFQSFCYKKDAIEGMCVLEFLDRNSENDKKLRELAKLIWPFFKKIYFTRKDRLAFFEGIYHWISRDWNTGETSSLSLEQITEYDKHLIKLNGSKRYFKFTYGDPLTR